MTVLNSQQNKLWPVNGKQYWAKRVAGWKAGWQNSGYIYCVLPLSSYFNFNFVWSGNTEEAEAI